jgi:tetratricopeptide (TPR) repeat protein
LPERIDVQIPAGSLPLHFRSNREAFPRRKRFLVVEPKLEAMWRDRLAALGTEMKVGISWRAGGKPTERRKRSIPLDQWGELLATPGVRFVNLQYGDAIADIVAARARFGVDIHDWEEGDPLVDIDSYVAKISALDLVISVGNATVHMAGAVGTSAWTLLPTLPSWRWMFAGDVSPWYCGVRLFRQRQRGEWQPELDRIARLLERAAASQEGSTAAGLAVEAAASERQELREAAGRRAKQQANGGGHEQADDKWLGGAELVGHEILDVVNRMIADGQLADQLGDFARAEAAFREVLQLAPRHVKGLTGLGIVARKTHRRELAIRCFRRALAVAEPVADHHLHLADALLDAGRIDEALSSYRRALDLAPTHAGAHLQIGRVLRQSGRHEEAASHFRAATASDPRNHEALLELGRSLADGCRIDEAIDCFRRALELQPTSVAALEAMGSVYLEDHSYEDAEACFRKAIALNPNRAESHFHLGRALEAQGRAPDAAAVLEQAVALDPRAEGPLLRLALVRRSLGEFDEAVALLRRAASIKPDDAEIMNSLGVVLREQGQTAEALRAFDCVLDLQRSATAAESSATSAEAHLNRGLALLQAGRLSEGWAEYEWRGRRGESSREHDALPQRRWRGEPLDELAILVHGEQSLAEELMFASCYDDIVSRAAGCVIVCDPRLERLLKRSFPAASVYPVVRGGEGQWRMPAGVRCDVQIPAGGLPLHLRPATSSFPRRNHFLAADPARVALWRQRYATTGEGLKIGLAWNDVGRQSTGRGTASDDWRSLVRWSSALSNRVQWINLQDGTEAKAQRAALQTELAATIYDWPDAHAQYDVDDVAARIAALDLMISIEGVPAHLAGALGVPAWVLVRREDGWRWLSDGDTTPWYSSVRLFRSGGRTDAINPIASLRDELLKRMDRPAEEQRMRSIGRPHWNRQTAPGRMS